MELTAILIYILTQPVPLILVTLFIILFVRSYRASSYYASTGNSIWKIIFDKGKRGEYSVYTKLRKHEKNGSVVLVNLHIPNKNRRKTAEIDLVMLSKKGIFVFESKNYGGVIEPYAANPYEDWRQTIGHKNIQEHYFTSPIRQNEYHIRSLSDFFGRHLTENNMPFYSIVVFSNRCSLINAKNLSVPVVKVRKLKKLLASYETLPDVLCEEDIETITKLLYPFTEGNIKYVNSLQEDISLTNENGKWRNR